MPTITFSLEDLNRLIGKKITIEKLEELLEYAKAELDSFEGGIITVSMGDTNQPYLWSVEGLARLLKTVLGLETGLRKVKAVKSKDLVVVDKNVKKVRPYISAFAVKGCKMNDEFLKQLIQLQEKLCHSFGMRRKKVAIGIYNYDKIKFPVHYKVVNPESVSFVPLEFKREMTLNEILETHPKGVEFAWILEGYKNFPILVDSNKQVLSFPPIINSDYSGKVEAGDSNLFFEATGTDLNAVRLAANIFAYAFAEHGFKIHEVCTKYGNKIEAVPYSFNEKVKADVSIVNKMLGLNLKEKDVKVLLKKMGYGYEKGYAVIPDYRQDIMHMVDVIEDVGISFGFENIPNKSLESYSTGKTFRLVDFVDKVRELVIGLGYQEVLSPILTNKNLLYEMTNVPDFGTVEIENYMSENYSVVRTWIIPQLLELLSRNKKEEYPQKVFEQGLVTMRRDLKDYERIALLTSHAKADYTEVKQALDYILSGLRINYEIEETEHKAFIPGRVARVKVNGKGVAYIGEIHPEVLENFKLNMPVAAIELNLTDLFNVICQKI